MCGNCKTGLIIIKCNRNMEERLRSLTEETAFELGCGEEDFARMRKGMSRFGEQVQKAQGLTLCLGAAASGVTRG